MSLFKVSDFAHKTKSSTRKNQKITQTKVKLPTQLKTKKKKCSLCSEEAIKRIQISDKEFRDLCKIHYADYQRKDMRYSAKFEKAKI